MKVLHVHAGNLYGGVETLLVTLSRKGFLCPELEHHFALCFDGRLASDLLGARAPLHVLGRVRLSRPWTTWQARRALSRVVEDRSYDAVICHSSWAQAVFGPEVRRSGLPLLFWLHGVPSGRHWLERLARRIPPDLIVCNSHFTAATAHRLYPQVERKVVYCPLSREGGRRSAALRPKIRADLKTSGGAVVIIQVSRMESGKGQAILLEALASLARQPEWVCWQVGGPQRRRERYYLEGLRRRAASLQISDRIHFLGERKDVGDLLGAADIFCQPNTGPEGFGLTFIEALDAGLPVITTGIGGAREIINEGCGILTGPGDVPGVARALASLIQDRTARARMGASGRKRASSLCDPEKALAALRNGLTLVLGKHEGNRQTRCFQPGAA